MTAILAAFLPVAMMILMFSLGLRLALRDITGALRGSPAYGAGLALQVLGLPLLAFAIGSLFGLSPMLMAGLMLVAASPGGVTSNYATHLARGKVGLSVAMTLSTSLLAPITLPLVLVAAGVTAPQPAGLLKISLGMSAVAIVPMLLGMALAHFAPRMVAKMVRVVDPLAKLLFVLMVLATFAQNWGAMQRAFAETGMAVVTLAVIAPMLAFVAGRGLRLEAAATRTIMTEVSLQNVAITIFVAGALLKSPELSIPGLIYAVVMNLVVLVLIGLASLAPRGAEGTRLRVR
ncbi:bile acid:sodium symporter [Sinirhodobacter sp. HNIBRBA609]|nr:bile acid:sodium symporter [Sinirhodobacter sp. HNIBRBA609]